MKTPVVLFLLWLVPIVPGFVQSGGSSGQAKALEPSEVAPAATVVPSSLVAELLWRPQYVCPVGRPRLWTFPEGRTYGKYAVVKLQRAWRDSRSPKPEPRKPQSSSKGTKPENRR